MSWDIALGAGAALLGSLVGGLFAWGGTSRQLAHDEKMRMREARIKLADELLANVLAAHAVISDQVMLTLAEVQKQNKEYRQERDHVLIDGHCYKAFSLSVQIGDAELSKAVESFRVDLSHAVGAAYMVGKGTVWDQDFAQYRKVLHMGEVRDWMNQLDPRVEEVSREVGRIKGLLPVLKPVPKSD